jgi:hypothetical protein
MHQVFRGKAEDFLFGGVAPGTKGRMDSPADGKTAIEAQISSPKTFQGILGTGGDVDLVGGKLLSKESGKLSYAKVGSSRCSRSIINTDTSTNNRRSRRSRIRMTLN